MTSERYNARESEPRWQRQWDEEAIFASKNDDPRPKYYVLEMFPYPSGRIHIGHVRNYTLGDVLARFMRAKGFNVLHPMGWDAFGLPAENAAIERKVAPKAWTYDNIAAMKKQLQSIGLSLDWAREFATCDPGYYKHQQKMFLDFLRAGLAEREKRKINWDPVDMTVLANEQVIDGRGWRSGAVVEQREMNQWVFKITRYSQELLDALDTLDRWPDKVRLMQRNWIGRSRRHAGALRARSRHLAGRRNRAEDFHHPARHAVRRQVHGDRAGSSAGAGRGREESEAGGIHRRVKRHRHRAGNHRHRREAGFRYRHPGDPPVRPELEAAGLCRQFRADGIRHRRDLRLPRARPARPRFRQQIRPRQYAGGLSARARIRKPSSSPTPPMTATAA